MTNEIMYEVIGQTLLSYLNGLSDHDMAIFSWGKRKTTSIGNHCYISSPNSKKIDLESLVQHLPSMSLSVVLYKHSTEEAYKNMN